MEKKQRAEEMRKLVLWQGRLKEAEAGLELDRETMNLREDLYDGKHIAFSPDGTPAKEKPQHVRNVCLEMVETQVDSTIPTPKVTAVRPQDEKLARVVECMISNVMDRLPMERMNDLAERVSPIQGGFGMAVGWDTSARGVDWMGALTVDLLHPREIVPQPGIYEVKDMDWLFLKQARTKRQIRERYGVDVSDEAETDADARTADGATDTTGALVTQITAYYRNSHGIGRFSWVGNTVLEDLEDYQLRRVHVCKTCGAVGDGEKCRFCGGNRFQTEVREYEELSHDVETALGSRIEATELQLDELGQPTFEPAAAGGVLMPQMLPGGHAPLTPGGLRRPVTRATRIPYFRPDVFPVVIRKNVSRPGRFWGGSDIDAITDQQSALNKVSSKINKKVFSSGSFTTIPKNAGNFVTDGDSTVLRVDNPKDMQLIHTFSTQAGIEADLRLRSELYEEARQTIGVTDSMQGRRDPTATSAVAKQFSAQQAQGRMESKHVMKQALFQDLFQMIFYFMLAYCDTPRTVRGVNEDGDTEYLEFNRYDFLYRDEGGQLQWNTDFLFSCDNAAPLAKDRQALWQETRLNFKDGALGPVGEPATLVRFWEIMERLHYPMAGSLKEQLRRQLQEQPAPPADQKDIMPDGTETPGGYALQTEQEGGAAYELP